MTIAPFVYLPGPTFNPAPFPKVVEADPSRIRNVIDPLGQQPYVTRFECRAADVTPDRCRAELIAWDRIDQGQVWCQAWSFLFGDGVKGDLYTPADQWTTHGQIHYSELVGQLAGSPLCELVGRETASGPRLYWVVRPDPGASASGPEIDIGPVPLGHRVYVKVEIVGGLYCDMWLSVDSPPGLTKPKTAATSLEWEAGYWAFAPQAGVYRNPGGPVPVTVAYLYGIAAGPVMADVTAALGWTTVSPPAFIPDVAGAIIDNRATLDWMVRTKTSGGLGYTVARAMKTHAYAEIVKLGGTWPA